MEHIGDNQDCLRDLSALETSLNSHIGEPVVVLTGHEILDEAIAVTGVNLGYSGDKDTPLYLFNLSYETEAAYAIEQRERVIVGYDEVFAYIHDLMDDYTQHDRLRSAVMAIWVASGHPDYFGPLDTTLIDDIKEQIRTKPMTYQEAYEIVEALMSTPVDIQTPIVAVIEEHLRDYIGEHGVSAINIDGLTSAYLAYLHELDGSDTVALIRALSR